MIDAPIAPNPAKIEKIVKSTSSAPDALQVQKTIVEPNEIVDFDSWLFNSIEQYEVLQMYSPPRPIRRIFQFASKYLIIFSSKLTEINVSEIPPSLDSTSKTSSDLYISHGNIEDEPFNDFISICPKTRQFCTLNGDSTLIWWKIENGTTILTKFAQMKLDKKNQKVLRFVGNHTMSSEGCKNKGIFALTTDHKFMQIEIDNDGFCGTKKFQMKREIDPKSEFCGGHGFQIIFAEPSKGLTIYDYLEKKFTNYKSPVDEILHYDLSEEGAEEQYAITKKGYLTYFYWYKITFHGLMDLVLPDSFKEASKINIKYNSQNNHVLLSHSGSPVVYMYDIYGDGKKPDFVHIGHLLNSENTENEITQMFWLEPYSRGIVISASSSGDLFFWKPNKK